MDEIHTDIIPRHSIEALCMAFNAAVETARKCHADMKAANERLSLVWGEEINGRYKHYGCAITCMSDLDKAIREAKRNAWVNIIERVGIRNLMSISQQAQLDKQLWGGGTRYNPTDKDELPALTPDAIYGWLAQLHNTLPDMFNAALDEVFDWLTPQRRDGYKTNDHVREIVGRKVILGWGVERGYGRKGPSLRIERRAMIMALGNVFSLLDGKGPLQHPNDLYTKIDAWWRDHIGTDPYEDDYFRIKGYAGTGTLHIELRRSDLVRELNVRCAKRALSKGAA